jgi:hypothetical protein
LHLAKSRPAQPRPGLPCRTWPRYAMPRHAPPGLAASRHAMFSASGLRVILPNHFPDPTVESVAAPGSHTFLPPGNRAHYNQSTAGSTSHIPPGSLASTRNMDSGSISSSWGPPCGQPQPQGYKTEDYNNGLLAHHPSRQYGLNRLIASRA